MANTDPLLVNNTGIENFLDKAEADLLNQIAQERVLPEKPVQERSYQPVSKEQALPDAPLTKNLTQSSPQAESNKASASDSIVLENISLHNAVQKIAEASGHSATDVLLGLNLNPSILGALVPPPGSMELLNHLSASRRRTILHKLLDRQRKKLYKIAGSLNKESEEQENQQNKENKRQLLSDQNDFRREVNNLEKVLVMLDEVAHLLDYQDYTFNQIISLSDSNSF